MKPAPSILNFVGVWSMVVTRGSNIIIIIIIIIIIAIQIQLACMQPIQAKYNNY